MTSKDKLETRKKILKAAQEIFIEKGKDGARMQEIADRAEVNKAMLFYYYTNKELLYNEVLKENMMTIFEKIKAIVLSEQDQHKKIEKLIDTYINFFKENVTLPSLIIRELASGGENIRQVIRNIKKKAGFHLPDTFVNMIMNSILKKQFRNVDPKQTILNIVGMCVIYFIGKPLIEIILDLEDIDTDKFLEERKESIIHLLEHGILNKE